ncbi:hypothetical protein NKF26_04095 [Haladaptatus sp. AB618]|uniref:hypothetical protein n=1 Tax=Haladaptatus sp. AB618 TaxID=2934173 RepID=UPI00209C0236|nr:hypothetical protein [Haladaptatus sp. AB618]MCO8252984.1 hypothetical protein [Haladaptatus sp. AB618]
MKFKPVPEAPENLDFVRDVQRALPLVPDVTDDCCARVMRRAGVENRDAAGTWLTFLRALELAEETEDGTFVRRRREPERNELAESFQARVYGASTVLGILFDEDPLEADAVFEAFSETVPSRGRDGDSRVEAVARERVGNVLDWAVLLGLAERTNGGYVRA